MKAVILAAGRGTRMGSLTDDCPKPMLPILGRPKLAYTVEQLPDCVDEVIFVIGYLGEQIKAFFGNQYHGMTIRYVTQKKLNGTGGAVMLVQSLVGDEPFLVLMGDDLYRKKDLEKMLMYDFALLAYESDDAEAFGLVTIDAKNLLQSVIERPHPHVCGLVNTGAYVLSQAYFDMELCAISDTEYGLPQTLVAARTSFPVHVVITTQWFPIGTPEALVQAQEVIKNIL